MYLSLLVCAKAAWRKSLPRTGRQWPASGAPAWRGSTENEEKEEEEEEVGRIVSAEKKKKSKAWTYSVWKAHTDTTTCMVRQYVTTMMTSGMKKATKEPMSTKRSSLRTQLSLTKTLSLLWRPITGIGIDTPKERVKGIHVFHFYYY